MRAGFVLICLLLGGLAWAAEVEVIDAETLELRNIQLPGGDNTTLYVFTGSPVRLRVDGDLIIAERIEFDNESRLLRIIGAGDVSYGNVATKGRNYVLDLRSSQLAFQDVFIFTNQLDVQGVQAVRQPGQIDITVGAFSPCSRCGQRVQDYRFTAERMNLYPGDRLVAFNVTVYIRELPSFFLPLMVVPLGPPERQPRLQVQRGSATERAEVALDWPYVFGANALGTLSLRYFADVFPGLSNSVTENLLGGTVLPGGNYFGGGFEHTFYTATGQGNLDFFYTPPFLEYSGFDTVPIGQERDEYRFSVGYTTEEALEGLQLDLLFDRDDALNDRIMNLTTRASYPYGGFDFNYVTQTYFDLDLTPDTAETPAYGESEGALRTYAKVQASQNDEVTFSVGPFSVSNLLLELGFFEDYANSSNRSAFASPIYVNSSPVIRSGRAVERHTVTLDAFSPYSGASLSGSTAFAGQYYSTTNENGEIERLIDWDTALSFDQTFAGGSLGLDYNRNILEGESPFGFDSQSAANRTDLTSELLYSPLEWLDLSVRETYVFEGDRGSDDGPGPIETRLDFFDASNWFSASLEQRYDVEENDPGLLGTSMTFASSESALNGSLTLSGAYDLAQRGAIEGGPAINESEVNLEADLGYDIYGALDVALGYDFNADPDTIYYDYGSGYGGSSGGIFDDPDSGEDAGSPLWTPLEVGLSVGTLEQEDDLPGLRAAWQFDINEAQEADERGPGSLRLEVEGAGRIGPIELSASQSFDFETQDASDSVFSIAYPDIIELQASGFRLLPPSLFGLIPNPQNTVTYGVSLADLTQQDVEKLYEVTYETSYGPLNDFGGTGGGLGFTDTTLTAQLALPLGYIGTDLGSLGFGADFSSTLQIADDAQPATYLSSSDLTLTTDFFSTFALQGTLAYDAIYDTSSGTGDYTSQTLGFTDFGGTVRLFSDLYLSVIMNDTWDFANPDSSISPYNFQPIFYLTLDRCCWAFYGAYNSANGTVSLTLGYPGSDTGITGAFETGLELPGRDNVPSGGSDYDNEGGFDDNDS